VLCGGHASAVAVPKVLQMSSHLEHQHGRKARRHADAGPQQQGVLRASHRAIPISVMSSRPFREATVTTSVLAPDLTLTVRPSAPCPASLPSLCLVRRSPATTPKGSVVFGATDTGLRGGVFAVSALRAKPQHSSAQQEQRRAGRRRVVLLRGEETGHCVARITGGGRSACRSALSPARRGSRRRNHTGDGGQIAEVPCVQNCRWPHLH